MSIYKENLELVEMGLQMFLSDKMLQDVAVESERNISMRGTMFMSQWKAASKTLTVERLNRKPAGFWDYVKQYIPLMQPRFEYNEIHIINRCPHAKALDPKNHLNWTLGNE